MRTILLKVQILDFGKALLRSCHIILENQKWVIGNGSRVGICSDKWIANLTRIDDDDQLYPFQSYIEPCRTVEDLTIKDGNILDWNDSLVRSIWCNEIVGEILQIPLVGGQTGMFMLS